MDFGVIETNDATFFMSLYASIHPGTTQSSVVIIIVALIAAGTFAAWHDEWYMHANDVIAQVGPSGMGSQSGPW
eukprot:CAMPEP_0201944508 /NCGR_PEP_ID=MMETSP0903-20130614/53273_1 /ASSEMBLY_ACC=CAM_ASM_000552 /TAXON_ID=420261 /ORGANISM="Thalassiosira antarctica, Strain CCMP982" /LENGTH=73 /DNA_ID=CAMNT_0048487527 /DNA_START=55 /DNA_END=273 /DNA_ORIENTATION=+